MANSNIAIRFTDETYATKSELSYALGISSIDPFWTQILDYRAQFQRFIDLKTLHQIRFCVTFTPTINQKLNSILSKLAKLDAKIGTISELNSVAFRKEQIIALLRNVTCFENKKIGEMTFRTMVSGTYKESNADHTSILNYLNAINAFVENPSETLNEDFLAKYYGILLDEDELTSFYRLNDPDNAYKFKTTIVGKDYDYAHSDIIPSLMEDFFNYISSGGGDPFAKAIMALYYFDYVKPFGSYNKELGCLVAKSVIASFGYEKVAPYINFESIFTERERYNKLFLETQRSGDVTYIILYALNLIEKCVNDTNELISRIEVNQISNEQYQELRNQEPKVEVKEVLKDFPKTGDSEQLDLFGSFEEEIEEIKPVEPKPQPVVKEKPIEEPKPVPKPTPKHDPIFSSAVPATTFNQKMVKPVAVQQTSVQDAKEYAKYIAETNPSIRYTQALFFATHSEMGHYYSIQDYKKATKCVYETARTSMDNLAAEGYYDKLKIKNKFVYTPRNQGGK